MKKVIMVLITIVLQSYCQLPRVDQYKNRGDKSTDTSYLIELKDSVEIKLPRRDDSRQNYFGIRFGAWTWTNSSYGKWKLEDWWTFFLLYEYRFKSVEKVSFFVEYQYYGNKYHFPTLLRPHAFYLGLKLRIVYPTFELGISPIQTIDMLGIFCGGNLDLPIYDPFSLQFNFRYRPGWDLGYLISIGSKIIF